MFGDIIGMMGKLKKAPSYSYPEELFLFAIVI